MSHVTDLIYPFLASLDNPDSCTGLSVDLFEAAMKELVTEVPTGLPLLGDFHGDQNSLRAQRWGIVVPEGSNETELLDQIAPLIKLRESQQGASAIVYKAPHALDARAASKWCDNIYEDENVAEMNRPRYLLLLGDFDRISIELQQVLGMRARVGRLAFRSPNEYKTYCEKVIRWEATSPLVSEPNLLLVSVRDHTPATESGFNDLMVPCHDRCQPLKAGAPQTHSVRHLGHPTQEPYPPTKSDILAEISNSRPTVMLSMSHGLGPPLNGWASVKDQRSRQGALCLSKNCYLEAEDIASRSFLPGGMWFCFSCFGAGTPMRSVYHHWLQRLLGSRSDDKLFQFIQKSLANVPFVSALPQAALANPEGPLAFIGHVDLVWSYSYSQVGSINGSRVSHYLQTLVALCKGIRAGQALLSITESFKKVQHQLVDAQAAHLQGQLSDIQNLANLWMQRNDLLGFILLGDPAARLSLLM